MTQHVKRGSDRPNPRFELLRPSGTPVNLARAAGVQLRVHAQDGTTVVDSPAEVVGPHAGLVEYDVSEGEFENGAEGTVEFDVEIRVDWPDGDEQWFPIDGRAYGLRIVSPPGERGTAYGETTYGEQNYGGGL